jgi:hypothetical protein
MLLRIEEIGIDQTGEEHPHPELEQQLASRVAFRPTEKAREARLWGIRDEGGGIRKSRNQPGGSFGPLQPPLEEVGAICQPSMMSSNDPSEGAAQTRAERLESVQGSCGGMIDAARRVLDVGVIGGRKPSLKILSVLAQVMPQTATAAEAGGIEGSRETLGGVGDGVRVIGQEVDDAPFVPGVSAWCSIH